jgi:parallel beta-helix repeat protein
MKKRLLSKILLILLLLRLGALVLGETNAATSLVIHIKADGEVDPSYVPISRFSNYYRLEDNISGSIIVERSNVVIDGAEHFLLGSQQGSGIYLSKVSNITVENLKIRNFESGIFLYESNNLCFAECLSNENLWGLRVVSSSYLVVLDCNISGNGFGIVLQNCSEIDILNSSIMQNSYHGIFSYLSSFNSIRDNNIWGNYRGIYLDFSSNNEVVNNSIIDNFYKGVRIAYADSNLVSGNNISGSQYGFWFYESSFNTFFRNYLTFNGNDDLLLELDCNSNSIFENVVSNSEVGLFIDSSSDNVFLHNNFLDNDENVVMKYQNYSNVWDDGVEGNFWDDYAGGDSDRNGVGDADYVIDSENFDTRPLMGFFNRFELYGDYYVNVISNSTIENFVFFEGNGTMKFQVFGSGGFGFCRVMVPREIANSSDLLILIDDGEIPVLFSNYEVYANATHFWIYFAYENDFHEIQVLSEYPVWFGFSLFLTLLVIIFSRVKSKLRST